ncbi:hypothetical protein [Streptomyces sp. NPDC006307]|uniref:hypothetical protein n=1 Tax=Streptomyces sp. NPDC006307 TaxID=3156748 RepID=UPI00339EC7E8
MLARVGRCAATYVAVHAAAWVLIALVTTWEDPLAVIAETALIVLVMTGLPTVLVTTVAGLFHTRMDPGLFRIALVGPALVFAWPVLGASTSEPVLFQFMAQLAFLWLAPTPLLPERWARRA